MLKINKQKIIVIIFLVKYSFNQMRYIITKIIIINEFKVFNSDNNKFIKTIMETYEEV